jgi:hypothetical protein
MANLPRGPAHTERALAVSRVQGAAEPPYPLSSKLCFDCRAVDSTGIKVEGEGEWNSLSKSQILDRIYLKYLLYNG